MNKFRRTTQLNGPLTVGYSDTGYDVVMYGATAGCNVTWDESADELDISATTEIQAAHKLQFRDTAIFLQSGADGQLDIDADGKIDLASASITMTGEVNITGSLNVTGSLSMTAASTNLSGELNVTGSADLSSSMNVSGCATFEDAVGITKNLNVAGSSLFGSSASYSSFDADGTLTMTGTARVIKSLWLQPRDVRADVNGNWTAGSNANASTFAWQYGSSGTAGCAQIGFAVPTDMDTTATGCVDVLWSAGCVAAANASMNITYLYYGIGDGSTPGGTGTLTGAEGSGTGGASAFEYTNVTDALVAPAASTRHMTLTLCYTPNTAQSSAGSTFQLNGMVVKYLSNKLGTAT